VELDLFSHWKRETYDILSRADQYVGGESEKKRIIVVSCRSRQGGMMISL
jgi:hypothetical protein